MEAHLTATVAKKKVEAAHAEQLRAAAAAADTREQEWARLLSKAKLEAKEKAQATPTLLADEVRSQQLLLAAAQESGDASVDWQDDAHERLQVAPPALASAAPHPHRQHMQ